MKGLRLPVALHSLSQPALGILRMAPVPSLGDDKGSAAGDPGSRLHPADSVPPDTCPSPGGPMAVCAGGWESQKGPSCDSWTQGMAASSSPPSLLSFCWHQWCMSALKKGLPN